MRIVTVISTQTNGLFQANKGYKVLNAEWAEWGGGVQLHVEMSLNEPIETIYLAALYPGMGVPKDAEFVGVIKNPFGLLYAIPEKA